MKTECERCNGGGRIYVQAWNPEDDDEELFCPDCHDNDGLIEASDEHEED